MNNSLEENRVSITPSARASIHRHNNKNMGRYGLNISQDKNYKVNSPRNNERELDEVDNALSKMQKISPLLVRKKKKFRTNSYSEEEENSEENYSSNVLSKSLPSTLSPRLYSSDDSLPAENYAAFMTNSRSEANYSEERFNISNQSSDSTRRFQREPSVISPIERQVSNKSYFFGLAVSIAVLIVAIIHYNEPKILESLKMDIMNHYKSTQTEIYDVKTFEYNMDNLKEKYNIDNDLILKLKNGILTIFSRNDSGSFMFVYNSKRGNFNPSQFDKFINEVAYTAARYLRNNIASIQHTVIMSSNLDMQEHGELMDRYKDDVDKSGVLLVKEIDSVPSELAMAFHYYCDEYNPLIKRSAIFFTLNVANCSNTSDKKSRHDFVEKCLAGKWKTLPPENMRPLLTRVVDSIIDVTSVF